MATYGLKPQSTYSLAKLIFVTKTLTGRLVVWLYNVNEREF